MLANLISVGRSFLPMSATRMEKGASGSASRSVSTVSTGIGGGFIAAVSVMVEREGARKMKASSLRVEEGQTDRP